MCARSRRRGTGVGPDPARAGRHTSSRPGRSRAAYRNRCTARTAAKTLRYALLRPERYPGSDSRGRSLRPCAAPALACTLGPARRAPANPGGGFGRFFTTNVAIVTYNMSHCPIMDVTPEPHSLTTAATARSCVWPGGKPEACSAASRGAISAAPSGRLGMADRGPSHPGERLPMPRWLGDRARPMPGRHR